MEIDAYLERIQYAGGTAPTIENLRELQRRHLTAIPFENLDIHLGRPISLKETALFEKIVTEGRGGFCYELNGLFAWLLKALGYRLTYLSASDAREDGGFSPAFDHLTLLVGPISTPDSPAVGCQASVWLADVGWGDTFREPLEFRMGYVQIQGERAFRIEEHEGGCLLWQRTPQGRWKRDFRFDLEQRGFADFLPMCAYHQTSPESRWTQERLCTIAKPGGRVTLKDSRLIITKGTVRREREICDAAEYSATLEAHFGIRLAPEICMAFY